MTTHDQSADPLLRLLARLPLSEPRAAASEQVRARCHHAFARQRRAAELPRRVRLDFIDATLIVAVAAHLVGAVAQAVWLIRG